MKIAFCSTYDATDRGTFASMGYYQGRCLQEAGCDVDFLGPLTETRRYRSRAKQALHKALFHRHYSPQREPALIKDYARQIEKKISGKKYDIIFSAISPASQPIAYLDTDIPIVFWTDAAFSGTVDFYPVYSSKFLTQDTIRNGMTNERNALERASLALYWSDWAAQCAIADYDINPAKVKVVPVGPCIESNRTLADVRTMVEARGFDTCRLLFMGVDWQRKGADTAVRVAARLNAAGVKTELSLVGCDPPQDLSLPDFIKPLGFINKATPDGARRMNELFASHHFMITPSRAECFGLVFAEANSFGMPALARAVGGIPTAIHNNINGYAFDRNANLDEYVGFIAHLMAEPARYRALALSSFNEFATRLNWTTAGKTVFELLDGLRRSSSSLSGHGGQPLRIAGYSGRPAA
jgi:glycosyltransferase involved in cell wall biosynthesis